MALTILHLSDIHISSPDDIILKYAAKIGSACFSVLPSTTHLAIIISGDIAYSGQQQQYDAAARLIHDIRSTILSEKNIPITIVATPGNHDCNFLENSQVRQLLLESLENKSTIALDTTTIDACTEIQREFFKFRDTLEEDNNAHGDKLWRTTQIETEQRKIAIESLNLSWCSKLKEQPGKLIFPVESYADINPDEYDIRISNIHHPFNWISQQNYRPLRKKLRSISHIIISGHEHEGNVGIIDEAETHESSYIEGCVLQTHGGTMEGSSFNLIQIDLEKSEFSSIQFVWHQTDYQPKEAASWTTYRRLPSKPPSGFSISPDFQQQLDDPGAYLKHPNVDSVTLSDIFVYPDLRHANEESKSRRVFTNSSKLQSPETIFGGVVVEAEEKSGATSLLYQLYKHYNSKGFICLYINGKHLNKKSLEDLNKTIDKTISTQYGSGALTSYKNKPKSEKILLIDDFDEIVLKATRERINFIKDLRSRYDYLVLTVGELFEIRELLSDATTYDLTPLPHYKIQPFGHALRSQLIARWQLLGTDGTVSDEEQIARLDQVERLIDAVMAKGIIPSSPLYLLTFIQTVEAGRAGDFSDSALGYYYQYLLTQALQSAGVKPDKLTEFIQYGAQLAWYFHNSGSQDISLVSLRRFNKEFSDRWHTVDFDSRIDILVRSRILQRSGDDFRFHYPYIYYFLKGKYLSDNIADTEVQSYLNRCSQHLYVRDHANTILFVAHHTTDSFLLNTLIESLNQLFRDKKPVEFEGDTQSVNKILENAPSLVFRGGKPLEHRAKRNQLRDEVDEPGDELLDKEEGQEDLSLMAKLTVLFKSIEILGQTLKNQYSKIHRQDKKRVLKSLCDGPLRALQEFYDFFSENSELLATEIEELLKRNKKGADTADLKDEARKVAAGLLQAISYSFIHRIVLSINSDSIVEDIEAVAEESGLNSYALINIGTKLDSPKKIPKAGLEAIFSEVKNDLMASRILQIMILNRLYMFKTSEADMQWLSNNLKLDLRRQHAISYIDSKQRRLRN